MLTQRILNLLPSTTKSAPILKTSNARSARVVALYFYVRSTQSANFEYEFRLARFSRHPVPRPSLLSLMLLFWRVCFLKWYEREGLGSAFLLREKRSGILPTAQMAGNEPLGERERKAEERKKVPRPLLIF